MKRILLWLAILMTPALLWSVGTSNGRGAWRHLLSHHATASSPAGTDFRTTPGPDGSRLVPHIAYVPVLPPPTQPAFHVRLDGNPDLGLFVADPQGRRSGIYPGSHGVLREIPHSQVRRVLVNHGTKVRDEEIIITVLPAESTIYSVTISGRRAGKYRLAVGGVSPSLKSTTDVFADRVSEDTSVHYRVNLNHIVPLPPPGTPMMTAKPAPAAAEAFVSQTGQTVIEPADPASVAAAAAIDRDPCGYFLRKLKEVPYSRITRTRGELNSVFDNSRFSGCQVVLESADTFVLKRKVQDFYAFEGSYLYRLGWRQSLTLAAGGYGSGELGVEDRSVLCVVATDTPRNLIKSHGQMVPNDSIRVTVQCWRKQINPGKG